MPTSLDSRKEGKKKGQAPRCWACRKMKYEDEVTVTIKWPYIPYEQNFVPETMFYFCPKQQCINKIPHWTNIKPLDRIRADSSFTNITVVAFKDDG